jgi:hypothetical protein
MKPGKTTTNRDIPRALQRSAPREVRLSAGGIALLLFAAVTVAAAWAGAAWQVWRVGWAAVESLPAVATVTELVRVRGEKTRYDVMYRYSAGGQEYIGRVKLRKGDENRFPAGSRPQVRYLASNPSAAWLYGYGPGMAPAWALFATGMLGVVAFILIALIVRRNSRLLSQGRAALARVTGIHRVKHGEHKAWRIHFEYTALSGASAQGHYDVTKNPPEVGAQIPIVYDRDNPRRNARYPPAFVRLK